MITCPKCGTQNSEDAVFCRDCGAKLDPYAGGAYEASEQDTHYSSQQYQQPEAKKYDHTAEFDPKDISDNKVFAMAAYVLGTVGIIIALLAAHKSDYAMFHVRQSLKFTIMNLLLGLASLLLCWTIIVPILGGIFAVVLFVVRIICFVQVCRGSAKEPYIICHIGFLK